MASWSVQLRGQATRAESTARVSVTGTFDPGRPRRASPTAGGLLISCIAHLYSIGCREPVPGRRAVGAGTFASPEVRWVRGSAERSQIAVSGPSLQSNGLIECVRGCWGPWGSGCGCLGEGERDDVGTGPAAGPALGSGHADFRTSPVRRATVRPAWASTAAVMPPVEPGGALPTGHPSRPHQRTSLRHLRTFPPLPRPSRPRSLRTFTSIRPLVPGRSAVPAPTHPRRAVSLRCRRLAILGTARSRRLARTRAKARRITSRWCDPAGGVERDYLFANLER